MPTAVTGNKLLAGVEGMMRSICAIFALMYILLGLHSPVAAMSNMDQENKIEALKKEIAEIKTAQQQSAMLEEVSKSQNLQKTTFEFISNFYGKKVTSLSYFFPEKAEFSPADKKFLMLAASGGLISISCKDVKKYASGTEIVLGLVNFYSVRITNLKFTIEYSTEMINALDSDNFIERYKKFEKDKRTITERVATLVPGVEEKLRISIPEYKPEDVKYIGVSMEVGGMSFLTK